jgi:hypothetical protein
MNVFLDEHDQPSFKRCVDIKELSERLTKAGFALDPVM